MMHTEQQWGSAGHKVSMKAKIRNRYNQAPHLTQDSTWESEETQETSHTREPRDQPFPNVIILASVYFESLAFCATCWQFSVKVLKVLTLEEIQYTRDITLNSVCFEYFPFSLKSITCLYSKTYVKRPVHSKKRPKIWFQDQLSPNAG